ncbi:MAG TPA: ParB/Srx family N-terminal domain-containing protein [Solirubrobacteraceae bacterium]|nr:ParB/Srx family N-terminal domain-containing protein [Solirubrobacteraceae bacterium]
MAGVLIPVGQLLLDTENPRHEPVRSQREAIQSLIAAERQKLVVLANDILENGISPIDLLLVIPEGKDRYKVVEGNRRLAAIRMIGNPDLAEGTPIAAQMKRVAARGDAPDTVECAIVTSRDDATHWMELRHGGEAGGAAVVRWNTLAANRFSHRPGSQAAKAITFLETVEEGYPKNEVIKSLVTEVAAKRLTTLGRLVADPSFRDRVGMTDTNGRLTFDFPAEALEEFFEHVLGDLAGDVGVSQLKSKQQRTKYLRKTPKPEPAARLPEPQPLTAKRSAKPTKPKPKPRPTRPSKPFKELSLANLATKTQAVLDELRKLDVDKCPNTVAILMRVILEFTVEGFAEAKKLPAAKDLKGRVRQCLQKIDPSNKAPDYQSVRTGLADGHSIYAVRTLHGFVHNAYFSADGNTVRNIASNLEPFLQALNDDLA